MHDIRGMMCARVIKVKHSCKKENAENNTTNGKKNTHLKKGVKKQFEILHHTFKEDVDLVSSVQSDGGNISYTCDGGYPIVKNTGKYDETIIEFKIWDGAMATPVGKYYYGPDTTFDLADITENEFSEIIKKYNKDIRIMTWE